MFTNRMKNAFLEGSRELCVAALRGAVVDDGSADPQRRRTVAIREFLGVDVPVLSWPLAGALTLRSEASSFGPTPARWVRFVIDQDGAVELFYGDGGRPVGMISGSGFVEVIPVEGVAADTVRDLLQMIAEAT